MTIVPGNDRLEIPPQVASKLHRYQRKIWLVKFLEGICAAIFGLCVSYVVLFVLDRFIDTTQIQRWTILLVGSLGLAIWFPLVCHRWIWKSRRLEQVARILKVKHPRLGDYLLGIVELVHSENNGLGDGRSEALCRAALAQADRETADKDFTHDVPYARHRSWALIAAVPIVLATIAMLLVPAASVNALARWLMPWKQIDRYTFARVEQLPDHIVVPLSEQSELRATLSKDSRWNPNSGAVYVGSQTVNTNLDDSNYQFQLPPLKEKTNVKVAIGDIRKTVVVDPQPRPELTQLTATVDLPAYLQRKAPLLRDIRGGALSVASGSDVSIAATASRELVSATVDGQPVAVKGDMIETRPTSISDTRVVSLEWRDAVGLTAKTPLKLKIRAAEDEAPSIACRELEQQRVIMEKDVLSFEVDAADDYGVRTIGMEWKGSPSSTSEATAAVGEKVIYAGNPEAEDVAAIAATFSPQREKIAPQTIQLRIFAEDYLPDRPRVYSPTYTVYVLSEDEHAIWMTRRLDEWFKQSLETYEQEQALYKRNVDLRNLPDSELDRPETRRKIESQAAAEQAQSRRLGALTNAGEKLVQEAARNDQFEVGHLETLAEMIQKLKAISENRMPSVADLLKESADAEAKPGQPSDAPNSGGETPSVSKPDSGKPTDGQPQQSNSKPTDGIPDLGQPPGESQKPIDSVIDNPGQNDQKSGDQAKPDDGQKDETPKAPSVTMKESSMDKPNENDEEKKDEAASKPSAGKLSLPSLTLADPNPKQGSSCPAGKKMDEAVDAQEELLAEFQAVAEELQKLISNLEGTTFVKRLKALARREVVLAKDIDGSTLSAFGESNNVVKDATSKRTELLAERQRAHGQTLQHIEDDLVAYSNRVEDAKFKIVLNEMRDMEAVKQVRVVADRMVANEPGTSIAHSELLADTFDRWAEQLVSTAPGGS